MKFLAPLLACSVLLAIPLHDRRSDPAESSPAPVPGPSVVGEAVAAVTTTTKLAPSRILSIPISPCSFSCEGSGGPCEGVDVEVTVDCGATRCTVGLKLSGSKNGSTQTTVDKDGDDPVLLCVGEGEDECCVEIRPCSGQDWEDVESSCAALCHECYGG